MLIVCPRAPTSRPKWRIQKHGYLSGSSVQVSLPMGIVLSHFAECVGAGQLNETYWKYDLASNKPPDDANRAAENFLKARKKRTFEEDYEEHPGAIGRGAFAKTVLCTHRVLLSQNPFSRKRTLSYSRRWLYIGSA